MAEIGIREPRDIADLLQAILPILPRTRPSIAAIMDHRV